MATRRNALLLLVGLLAGLLVAPAGAADDAAAVPGCATTPDHPGGDWRHYGHDLSNTRNQTAETTIGPDNVADLEIAWTYSPSDAGEGIFYNTPTIFKGCAFLATATGYVIVRNADTGDLVWQTESPLDGNATSLIGGVITGSPAISDDFWIYVGVSRTDSPYVAAFRPIPGGSWELAWTRIVDETPNSLIVTGPLLYEVPTAEGGTRTLLFQGVMGAESTSTPRGAYAFLDPATGAILAKGYTIDDASYAEGYRGASIWGQSAIDTQDLYVYAPTGNPASKQREHKHANAVVKIDADPQRATFGQIVGHYEGNPDNYVEQVDLYDNPVCQSPLGNVGVVWGQMCLQQDLDFGAAPNLFEGPDGRTFVGALQKSGVYHVFDADTMQREWTAIVGTPGIPLNAASPAIDGTRVFVNAQEPGQIVALGREDGLPDWASPIADGVSFAPVTTANGVVYNLSRTGNLHMIDAETGIPIDIRPMTQELGLCGDAPPPEGCGPTIGGDSAGIAVARNMVYLAIPSHLIAYRLPAT